MPGHCCSEFSRVDLVRRAAAEAGNGLPAIEPGMPLPAGTGLDRRSFLSRTAALALTVYGASRLPLPGFDDGIARAAGGSGGRVLVSVFLPGGIDSMTTLAPVGDPHYRRLRPKLALPGDAGVAFAEDERLRWHPAAAPLAALHREGKLTVYPAVGYAGANQSHFTSRHFWRSARPTRASRPAGWAATSTPSARPTTRSRACRSTASSSPRSPPRGRRLRRSRRRMRTASGRTASGAR